MPEVFVMPEGWLSLDETKDRLGRSQRTIQKYVKAKHLKVKRLPRSGARPPVPAYWSADVERLAAEGKPKPASTETRPAVQRISKPKPTQAERALDTVSIVGQIMAAHKGELEQVVRMMLDAQKAEHDAERERRRSFHEDTRERWEIEQKRLERAEEERRERAKPWLSPRECYRASGLPARVVIQNAESGKLTAVRDGKHWRILRASLEAFAG